jgi:hypothetical protein
MTNAYVVTGTLTDAKTVQLDEPLPLSGGKVRVVVEAVEPKTPEPLSAFLRRIWADQNRRGHVPPTVEEVEARIREERDWGD